MPQVAPTLIAERLDTRRTYATSAPGDILPGWVVDRVGDAPVRVRFDLAMLSDFALALIDATGGPTLTGPIVPLTLQFSLDGGASCDVRFVLTSCRRSMDPARPVLTIDQGDLAALYAVTGADRVTYVGADPNLVLDGPPGSIPRPPGAIGATTTFPWVKGLDQITVGLGRWAGQPDLRMQLIPDPAIAFEPLSVDIYADTIANALKTIQGRLAGSWHPADPAPFGAHGHWVSHSGDGARNPLGVDRCISVGRAGTAPAAIFDGDTPGPWDETIGCHFASAGMVVEPLLADLYAQASFIGGLSDHGIDAGAAGSGGSATQITCGVLINTDRGAKDTRWDTNLPVLGTTAGVYYYPWSGFLVPMGQAMPIAALAPDRANRKLYAATPTGVFVAPSDPPPYRAAGAGAVIAPPWQRLGGLAAPVADVWLDGAVVLARCGGETKKSGAGIDGIYRFPALGGDTAGDTQGYAGWSRIAHSGSPVAAGGTAANLYYVDKNRPGTVYLIRPGTTAPPAPVTGIAAGQQVVGIDTGINLDGTGNGYVYIRTDAGAGGLYAAAIGSTAATAAGGQIDANDGSTVQVRRVVAYGAPILGDHIALLAATDAGLFRTPLPAGNGWSAPNATSGLGDFDIDFVAAGPEQTVLARPLVVPLIAGSARSLLLSRNAGDNWTELLGEKLDCGPFWAALAQVCGATPWPDNTIGGLGSVAGRPAGAGSSGGAGAIIGDAGGAVGEGDLSPSGPTDTGGSGTVLPIAGDAALARTHRLPDGWIWARRLNEQNMFAYRLVHIDTVAPMAGMQYHELSEIQAGPNVGVITASEQVALVVWRWLSAASVPRIQFPIAGSFTRDDAALRDRCFGDLVTVRHHPPGWGAALALDLDLYVVRHTMTGGEGYVATETTVSNSLEGGTPDADALAAAQVDRLSKRLRFGSA